MSEYNSFKFRDIYMDATEHLQIEQQKDIVYAIARYGCSGAEPTFDDNNLDILWILIKMTIDSDIKKSGRKNARQRKDSD